MRVSRHLTPAAGRQAGASMCLLLLALLASGCGSSSSTPAPTATPVVLPTLPTAAHFSAALVTDVGGLHDRSYNQKTWSGLTEAHRRYGVTVGARQSASEKDYEPNLRYFARRHATLIFAVGYTMSRAVFDVARAYPAQRFVMVDARPIDLTNRQVTLANVQNMMFKEQESGFLAGVLAGLMERHRIASARHNVIGYLGAAQIPPVQHYIAGYVAGAKRVDPSVTIVGQYARNFIDPALGQRIGRTQVRRHADILFQVASSTGTGYLEAANRAGVYGIGSDIDESFLGPFMLTSAVKRISVATASTVVDALAGHFTPGDRVFSAAEGATGIARPSLSVPPGVRARVRYWAQQVVSGRVVPPTSVPAR